MTKTSGLVIAFALFGTSLCFAGDGLSTQDVAQGSNLENSWIKGAMIQLRTGLVATNTNLTEGQPHVSSALHNYTAMDAEFSILTSNFVSSSLRVLANYDFSNATMNNFYVGVGHRYYFLGNSILPGASTGWRAYGGGEIGLSQNIVIQFSQALTASATDVEFGPNIGLGYQFSRYFGLDLNASAHYALSFGSIGSNATLFSALLGITHYL